MAESSITKNALANSLKELMKEKSLSKISIKDIVELCNMNRKSFYYHFKDKYDLVNWIYYTEFVKSFEGDDFNSEWGIMENICEFFYENRTFYSNALEVKGQNSFYDYFGDVLSPILSIEFEDIFKDDEYKQFYIGFFTDAIRTAITRWLLEGAKIPPKEFVILMKNAATGVAVKITEEMEKLYRGTVYLSLCIIAFTNGTLIDEKFAEEMLRVKNFIPAISVEGFEEETDFRRGKGTYQQVIRAMKILREKKLPFGISCCYTSKNVDVIGSEEYFDDMINRGAKFAWFFTYMPVGKNAVPELMATAEQRKYMYYKIREFRKTKPIFTMDFWNDGEYVKGCIAGARNYLHINANGDIEPCAFIHYSDSSVYKKTLLEAYKSPLFMQYHDNQPFNENYLRPCPLLDNPNRLAEMVDKSGAASTDLENPEDVHDLCKKCENAAKNWAIVADELWY